MTEPEEERGVKIETIEDVRAGLAEIRETLTEVQGLDFTDPKAAILVEPLRELRAALKGAAGRIEEFLAEQGHDGT